MVEYRKSNNSINIDYNMDGHNNNNNNKLTDNKNVIYVKNRLFWHLTIHHQSTLLQLELIWTSGNNLILQ